MANLKKNLRMIANLNQINGSAIIVLCYINFMKSFLRYFGILYNGTPCTMDACNALD